MRAITPLLKNEVEKTATTLKILEESQLVDAGALGFYYFIEGFTDFLEHKSPTRSLFSYKLPASQDHKHQFVGPPQLQYCTEAILKNSSISKQDLLLCLNKEGDCAAVIGTNDLLKIHFHTDNPIHLFNTLYKQGTIKYPKVDDIQRQYEIQFARKHTIAMVTDSSADLPQALLDKYQIHTVTLNIHISEHDVLDKYCFEPNSFYNQLQQFTDYPKTSCIPPHKVKPFLSRLPTHYDHVLILSISSAMSGMHDAFIEASKEDNQINVLDTKTNSAAHGLLLNYAGKLIAKNLPFVEVIEKIEAAIKNTLIFVLVRQFDSMMRSGRTSKLSAKIASWTHIKPIVSIDKSGRGVVAGKTLSSAAGRNKLIHLVQQHLKNTNTRLEDYAIVHADNMADSVQLAKLTTENFKKDHFL